MLLRFLSTLSNKNKVIVLTFSWLLSVLCFCLLIAGVINDGNNQFALSFYHKITKQEINPHYIEVITEAEKIAGSNTKFIELLKNSIPQHISSTQWVQMPIALGWFATAMSFAFVLFVVFATSVSLINYRVLKATVKSAYDESLIYETTYLKINEMVNQDEENIKNKKINETKAILELEKQKIENQKEEILDEQT